MHFSNAIEISTPRGNSERFNAGFGLGVWNPSYSNAEPDHKVVIDIDFGMVVARRTIDVEVLDENTTKVSWSETLQITNPLMRYLPLLVDSSVNESFNEVLRAAEEVAIADRSMPQ